jgi:hypothetical protein
MTRFSRHLFLAVACCQILAGGTIFADPPPQVFFEHISAADRAAFRNYRLTESNFGKLEKFAILARDQYARNAEFRNEWNRYANTEAPRTIVDGTVKAINRSYPQIKGVIDKAALPLKEYPLGVYTITMALWIIPPTSPADVIASRTVLPQDNVQFVRNHLPRCKRFLDTLPSAK